MIPGISTSKMPSQKILSVLIVVTATVFSVVIVFGKEKSNKAINSFGSIVSGQKISIPERQNWKSELEEISDNSQILPTTNILSTTSSSYTDKVSESLISNYLVLKQKGNINNTTAQNLVNRTQEMIENDIHKPFKRSQLSLVSNSDVQTITNYGENLGLIIKSNKKSSFLNELAILQEGIVMGNFKKLEELEKIAQFYESMSYALMKIQVPIIFAGNHLDMANGLKELNVGLKSIRKIEQDPLLSIDGMRRYQEGASLFIKGMSEVANHVRNNNITYKQGSGGYYLLNGI